MPPPEGLRNATEPVQRLRNTFAIAARGRYTMPIVFALGVIGVVVHESAFQHSQATLTRGIALTDARVKSAETLQKITDVGLYARSYILTAEPAEAQRYREAYDRLDVARSGYPPFEKALQVVTQLIGEPPPPAQRPGD